jgi:hypothetical protein
MDELEIIKVMLVGNYVLHTCIVTTSQNPDGIWNARVLIKERGGWHYLLWRVMSA